MQGPLEYECLELATMLNDGYDRVIHLLGAEPIGLEIVAFNGGSYTGAILFTGWMYIGAACMLWGVRAWKIGDGEEKAAMAGKSASAVDPVAVTGQVSGGVPEGFKKTPFMKRLLMWQRV